MTEVAVLKTKASKAEPSLSSSLAASAVSPIVVIAKSASGVLSRRAKKHRQQGAALLLAKTSPAPTTPSSSLDSKSSFSLGSDSEQHEPDHLASETSPSPAQRGEKDQEASPKFLKISPLPTRVTQENNKIQATENLAGHQPLLNYHPGNQKITEGPTTVPQNSVNCLNTHQQQQQPQIVRPCPVKNIAEGIIGVPANTVKTSEALVTATKVVTTASVVAKPVAVRAPIPVTVAPVARRVTVASPIPIRPVVVVGELKDEEKEDPRRTDQSGEPNIEEIKTQQSQQQHQQSKQQQNHQEHQELLLRQREHQKALEEKRCKKEEEVKHKRFRQETQCTFPSRLPPGRTRFTEDMGSTDPRSIHHPVHQQRVRMSPLPQAPGANIDGGGDTPSAPNTTSGPPGAATRPTGRAIPQVTHHQQHHHHHRGQQHKSVGENVGNPPIGARVIGTPDSPVVDTPLFERFASEEAQEFKSYARIIDSQNRRLAELERIHDELEARLEMQTREKIDLEAMLEQQEQRWAVKCDKLEKERDSWKGMVSSERTKNEKLLDLVYRKDKEIHRMIQRKYDTSKGNNQNSSQRGQKTESRSNQPPSSSQNQNSRSDGASVASLEKDRNIHSQMEGLSERGIVINGVITDDDAGVILKSPHEILRESGSVEVVKERNVTNNLLDFFGI